MGPHTNTRARRSTAGRLPTLEWLEDRCVLSHGGGQNPWLTFLQNFVGPVLHGRQLLEAPGMPGAGHSPGGDGNGDWWHDFSSGHHGHHKGPDDAGDKADQKGDDGGKQKDDLAVPPAPRQVVTGPFIPIAPPDHTGAVSLLVTTSGPTGSSNDGTATARVQVAGGAESASSTVTQVENSTDGHAGAVVQAPEELADETPAATLPARPTGDATEAATRAGQSQSDGMDARLLALRDHLVRNPGTFDAGWVASTWFARTEEAPVAGPDADAVFTLAASTDNAAQAFAQPAAAPPAAGRLLDAWTADVRALDQALGGFLARLDELGASLGLPTVARAATAPWLVGGIAVTVAAETARRRLRPADGWTEIARAAREDLGGPLPGFSF